MKSKLKSLYLDTTVGVYFYSRPILVSSLLLAVIAMIVAIVALVIGSTLHSALITLIPVMLIFPAVAIFSVHVTNWVKATQERWVDERATGTNPWLQDHPEQY